MEEKEYIIYQLHRMNKQLGKVPTCEEFIDRLGSYTYIKTHFGSYNNLLIECGYPVAHVQNKYSSDYNVLIDYMIEIFKDTGDFPTTEMIRDKGISISIVRNLNMSYTDFKIMVINKYIDNLIAE